MAPPSEAAILERLNRLSIPLARWRGFGSDATARVRLGRQTAA